MRAAIGAVGLLITAAACASQSENGATDTTGGRVCGLLDRSVVSKHLTGEREFRDIDNLSAQDDGWARCQLVDGRTTYLTAHVYTAEDEDQPDEWRSQLER